MAGIIPAPVNPAKGASKGRLFTGTAANKAGWQQLPITPAGGTVGDPAKVAAQLAAALRQLGVDTSAVRDWDKGLDAPVVAAGGAGIYGTGWHMQYGSALTATAYPVAFVQGMQWDGTVGHPVFDPAGTGLSARRLRWFSGAGTAPYSGIYKTYYERISDGVLENLETSGFSSSAGTGLVVSTSYIGSGGALLTTHKLRALHMLTADGATLVDFDYQA